MQLATPQTKDEFHATLAQVDSAVIHVQREFRNMGIKLRDAKIALREAEIAWINGFPKITARQALAEINDTAARVRSGELPCAPEDDYTPMSTLDAHRKFSTGGDANDFVRKNFGRPMIFEGRAVRGVGGNLRSFEASRRKAIAKPMTEDRPVPVQQSAGPVIRGGVTNE